MAKPSPAFAGPLFLGIDTGGTYTDAVLWAEGVAESCGVVAKAKALTTHHDLAAGISGAVGTVLAQANIDPSAIRLVSMSTTLATNAIVEGQGNRAALVMIGFTEADLARDGLKAALGADPVIFVPGGHDVHGNAKPLDLAPLEAALPELAGSVTGFAVCAYFATRNPAHEIAAAELIRNSTGMPVTASHELSAKLGGPRRALTTLLNARLVGLIDRLVTATETYLTSRGISAPLMVVRGDGALVSAPFARHRPIETILSGPAASIVGARHLTGLSEAIVSDIGGTTTDVAVLENGRPRLDPDGARVGGMRTHVEAVAMRTFGLGGDSEVSFDESMLDAQLKLGPRRLVPLALASTLHGNVVAEALSRQIGAANPGRLDGRFAMHSGLPDRYASGLSSTEAKLFAEITDKPQPLDRLLASQSQTAMLNRLAARGLVLICGFTPSDAAHVLGKQANWDREAAELGATLFARRRDAKGRSLTPTPEAFCERVLALLTRRSAEAMLETAFAEDGHDGQASVAHDLVQRALDGNMRFARLKVALDRPVIGLGASAPLHYADIGALVGNECILPAHADVANALGAVVGQVRVSAEALVSQPKEGLFRVSAGIIEDFADEAAALAAAERLARAHALALAAEAGAGECHVDLEKQVDAPMIEGQRKFIEARLIATAHGRPRIADGAPHLTRQAN